MSSPSLTHLLPATPVPARASVRLLSPTTQPIPLLSSRLAKRYSHVHTPLVVMYYYLRASALVADPFRTMYMDLVLVGLAQAVFCAVCLPSAGSWVSGTSGGKIIEGTGTGGTALKSPKRAKGGGNHLSGSGSGSLRKKNAPSSTVKGASTKGDGARGSWRGRVMPTLFSLVLTLTLPPLPLTLIALVLGAPLYPTSLLPHTLLLAMHVSLLGFLPIFYTHGVSSSAWRDVAAAWLPFDEAGVWAGTVGAMVGGWIGAVPMALDWDREWQKWPCTVLWGVVLGWAVGMLLTNIARLGVGKRINLSEKEDEPAPAPAPDRVGTEHPVKTLSDSKKSE